MGADSRSGRRLVVDVELDRLYALAVVGEQAVERGRLARDGGDAVASVEGRSRPTWPNPFDAAVMNRTFDIRAPLHASRVRKRRSPPQRVTPALPEGPSVYMPRARTEPPA